MTRITNNGVQNGNQSAGNAIKDLDVDSFLKLMIAELQNQDPLNPMENDQMLAQIGQMREIAASDQLTNTLDGVLLGQNIASATNLIGADIVAITDDNQKISGTVDKVSVADGVPKLHIEEDSGAKVSEDEGKLEAGKYNYKVVWEDDKGNLLGVETKKALEVDEFGKSIILGNLPETDKAKYVYRTDKTGTGPFHLVATLSNGKAAGYHDKINDDDMSSTVLSRNPILVQNAHRKYTISLNNVGEIRPPATPTTPTTPTNQTPTTPTPTTPTDPDGEDEEPAAT
jgi:flagellar basal-body rod modification protein FlgD